MFVTAENTIEIRTVDVLRADSRFAYLSGGASAGERITTTAIQAPTNGMAVRTEANAAAEPVVAASRGISLAVYNLGEHQLVAHQIIWNMWVCESGVLVELFLQMSQSARAAVS